MKRSDAKKQSRGSALLLALFSVTILTAIAMELGYQTIVEARISAQAMNQLKAYYAAKSAAELGIFRVFLFRKASAQFGKMVPDPSILDMIWTFPFAWPPPIPEEATMVSKDEIQKAVKASLMPQGVGFSLYINSEGSKIDINDLASPSKVIAQSTRKLIQQIYDEKMKNDNAFEEAHRSFDFTKLLNNITDWVDEDDTSMNGGAEKSVYAQLRNDFIPPNQPFKTMGELHMVEGMTDEIFDLLAPRLTVYGSKGINIRYATKEVLMSLSPEITEEIANEVLEARADPKKQDSFKDKKAFVELLQSLGLRDDPFTEDGKDSVSLIFEAEHNFRIKAAGTSGKIVREITAVTYDFDSVKGRLAKFMSAEASPTPTPDPGKGDDGNPTPTPSPSPSASPKPDDSATKIPKDRPTVIYWSES